MRRPTVRKHPIAKFHSLGTVLLLLAVLLAFAVGAYFVKSSIFWEREWRTTIVFTTKPIIVVSIPAAVEDKTLVITLPEDAYVQVPDGYGVYRLGAVWRLGELENRSELFAHTIEDLLGVKVTGWVSGINASEQTDLSENAASIKQIITPISLLTDKFKSNLSRPSLLHLSLMLALSRPESFKKHETERDPRLFIEVELPDGSKVGQPDFRALDALVEQIFADPEIRVEGLRLEIRNTSGVAEVGHKFARFLTNVGGTVIGVGNETGDLENCLIRVNEANSAKKIIRFVREEFGCGNEELAESDKADAILLLGTSFGRRWSRLVTSQ